MEAQNEVDFKPVLTTAERIEALRWLVDNDAATNAEEAELMELIWLYAGE